MKHRRIISLAIIIGILTVVCSTVFVINAQQNHPTSTPISTPTTIPTPTTTTTQGITPSTFNAMTQGVFGIVSLHEYGCGQPSPDGSGCNTNGTTTPAGEGISVTVNVADKIDRHGNVTTSHIIATYVTDRFGKYSANLNPGTYFICANDRDCSHLVSVSPGTFTEINVSIDSPRQ